MLSNRTPHPVTLFDDTGAATTLPTDGPAARVELRPDILDGAVRVNGVQVPIFRTQLGTEVTDEPEPQDGVTFIVARPVVEALPHRSDLVYVHGTVRDALGYVIGARALGRPVRQLTDQELGRTVVGRPQTPTQEAFAEFLAAVSPWLPGALYPGQPTDTELSDVQAAMARLTASIRPSA